LMATSTKSSSTCTSDEPLLRLSCSATDGPASSPGSASSFPPADAASPLGCIVLPDAPPALRRSLPINVSGCGGGWLSDSASSPAGTGDDGLAALAAWGGHSGCSSSSTNSHSQRNTLTVGHDCWQACKLRPDGPLQHPSSPLAGPHTPPGGQLQGRRTPEDQGSRRTPEDQGSSSVKHLLSQVQQLSMSPSIRDQQHDQQVQGCAANHLLRMSHPADGAAGPPQAPLPLRNALSLPSPNRQPMHPFLHNYHLLRQQQLQQQQQQL
jgi:hypothetical protein